MGPWEEPAFRGWSRSESGYNITRPHPSLAIVSTRPTPASTQSPPGTGDGLPRTVGLFAAIAVIVGGTIGSGIFRVPATVAARLGEPGPVLLAWVLGGALALFGALTLAELAAMYPKSGGVFAYLDEAFGPLPAFLFGWSQLAVIRA